MGFVLQDMGHEVECIAYLRPAQNAAEVSVTSLFLGRRVAGGNLSAMRALVASSCSLTINRGYEKIAATLPAPDPAAAARGKMLVPFVFDPDPYDEFNGADIVQFASLPAMADRAK